MLLAAKVWPGTQLPKHEGNPLVHDVLDRLGLLEHKDFPATSQCIFTTTLISSSFPREVAGISFIQPAAAMTRVTATRWSNLTTAISHSCPGLTPDSYTSAHLVTREISTHRSRRPASCFSNSCLTRCLGIKLHSPATIFRFVPIL